jgi:hypothetical protein
LKKIELGHPNPYVIFFFLKKVTKVLINNNHYILVCFFKQENDRIVCGTSTSPEAALLLLVRIQFLLLPDMVVVDLGATSHTNLVQLQAQVCLCSEK